MPVPGIVAILNIVIALSIQSNAQSCWFAGPRVDCGYVGIDQAECEANRCCWHPAKFAAFPHIDLPWCFQPNDLPSTYYVDHSSPSAAAGTPKLALGQDIFLNLRRSTLPQLGKDIPRLQFKAYEIAPGILRIRITDPSAKRWEVPSHLFRSSLLSQREANDGHPPPAGEHNNLHDSSAAGCCFSVDIDEDPFAWRILSTTHARVLWNSTGLRLIYKEQYLELSTWLDSDVSLFGAGERSTSTLRLSRNGAPRTLWNRDLGPTYDHVNSYGSHPFVLVLAPDGASWGYFLLSSNAMDIVPSPDRLGFRTTGGILDLFVFQGPTPAHVVEQLTRVVGRPALMPYWSLGWHNCKYGYKSVFELEEVVKNYAHAGIPLEGVWTDIDYMQNWKDFTFDPVNWPVPGEMQRFVAELQTRGQKWIPIIDPGIKVEAGYEPYELGVQQDAFMRGVDGKSYVAQVWPGVVHYPDFLSANTRQTYWTSLLAKHRSLVQWEGIWVDMNEASNFCTGDVCSVRQDDAHQADILAEPPKTRFSRAFVHDGPSSEPHSDPPPWVCRLHCRSVGYESFVNASLLSLVKPPYDVSNALNRAPLGTKGMSVLARHIDGTLQYDAHNLYGMASSLAMYESVQNITQMRPFVLTRSVFTGSGAYAAHWSGDGGATWDQMARTLPAIMNYGLFGIPMGGADICGFQGGTNEELCDRWVALGAFYPFARVHADLHSPPQEPYRWDSVAECARTVLSMRYSLLPYLYTAMRTSHETGMALMRPLWLNFPHESRTHGIDRQFMLGDALLVIPVLTQGATSVKGYFPASAETWYDMFDKESEVSGGSEVILHAPLGTIPLYVAGGHIIPMQQPAMITADVKSSLITLLVALTKPLTVWGDKKTRSAGTTLRVEHTHEQVARGHMYMDDGVSIEAGNSSQNFLRFEAEVGALAGRLDIFFDNPRNNTVGNACLESTSLGFSWPVVGSVKILGWHSQQVEMPVHISRLHGNDPGSGQIGPTEGASSMLLLSADSVRSRDSQLTIAFPGEGLELRCGDRWRVEWDTGDATLPDKA